MVSLPSNLPINLIKQLSIAQEEDHIIDLLEETGKTRETDFYPFFKAVACDEQWRNDHKNFTARLICKAHELLEYGNLSEETAEKIQNVMKNELPDVREIVEVDRPEIFNCLIDSIDHHHLELPWESLEKAVEDIKILIHYACDFFIEASAQQLILDALLEHIDTKCEGKIAFEKCLKLSPLVEQGLDITPLLEQDGFKEKALAYAIATFKRLDHPKFIEFLKVLPRNIKELNLSNLSGTNLKGIEQFEELKSLSVSNSVNLDDIHALQACERLVSLDVSNCRKLKNIKTLGNLENLSRVDLTNCPIPVEFLTYLVDRKEGQPSLEIICHAGLQEAIRLATTQKKKLASKFKAL